MAVLLALGFAIPASIAVAADAPTAGTEKKKDDVVELEKYEVVGSRILRSDVEGPQPVFTFKTGDIESRGYTSLAEFIQRMPFNSGTQASTIQTASFTRGAATANPRGLGSGRFLVLLNGRRASSYPLNTGPQTLGYNVSVFDFNSIPIGAVDSIEFLKDGASAIYGSDAVTGVLNIKLKKNYQGVSTDYLVGNSTGGHDMLFQKADVTVGTKGEKTQMLTTVSWSSNNSTFIRDYARSRSTDYSTKGDLTHLPQNLNSSLNWPANVNLTATQAAAAGLTTGSGLYVLNGGVPTANPTLSQFVKVASAPNANRYDFAQSYQLFPSTSYTSAYSSLRHEFNENLYAFGQFIYSDNQTRFSFTPSVIQSTNNAGTGPTGLLNVPANNPYNPFGIDLTNFLYRTNFGPPRKFDVKSTSASFLAGVGGKINSDWTWEIGATFGSANVDTIARNQIRATDLQKALNGTTRATALNPFGPSDNQALVDSLFTISNTVNSGRGQIYDANLTGKLFEIDGRDVGFATGGELRHESTRSDPDTSAYVGSGGGTPFKGTREVYSLYVEATVPVLKELEFQFAGRHEHYSDFGSTTKPKAGFKLRIPGADWVVLRGSYSESFKAPDLGTLYTAQTTSFTSTVVSDPKRPSDPLVQLKNVSGGNPNLKPENATIKYAGIIIDVPKIKGLSFLKGLELTADYFNFSLKDLINLPSTNTLLAREDQLPGAVVRDNSGGAPGPILYLQTVPFNVATQKYEGVDLGLHYRLQGTRFGDFFLQTDWTYVRSIKIDYGFGNGEFENVGYYNNPKWNGNASLDWEFKDFRSSISWDYRGAFYNDAYIAAGWRDDAVYVFNFATSYRGWKGIKVTAGINNILNQEPPFNGRETSSFDQGTDGWLAAGRTVYVKFGKEF